MGYFAIGQAAINATYQERVKGCVLSLAGPILSATVGSGAIQDDASNDLTTQSCKNWCLNYLAGSAAATDKVIGMYLLLNSDVASDPFGDVNEATSDSAMQWQLKHVLLNLVALG